jgi:hypothetical protein
MSEQDEAFSTLMFCSDMLLPHAQAHSTMNLMICVKSILAGVVAVVLGVPTIVVTLIIAFVVFYRPHATGFVSWDSRSLIGTWPFNWKFWLPVGLLFAIGFVWELRRASQSRSS